MFHQVKILDRQGKVKKVFSPKSLSQRYWGDFFNQKIKLRNQKKMKAKPGGTKKSSPQTGSGEMSFEDLYFSED